MIIRHTFDGQLVAALMLHMDSKPRPAVEIARAAGVSYQRAAAALTFAGDMGAIRVRYQRSRALYALFEGATEESTESKDHVGAGIAQLLRGGPLTTAEVMDYLYPEPGRTKSCSERLLATRQALLRAEAAGLVKRIEDNRIDKWAVVQRVSA